MRPVLEIEVAHPNEFASWTRWVRQFDSALRLYNSDLMLASLYCWQRGVFPLARVEVEADGEGRVLALEIAATPNGRSNYEPPLLGNPACAPGRPGSGFNIDPRHMDPPLNKGQRYMRSRWTDASSKTRRQLGEPAAVAIPASARASTGSPDLILSRLGRRHDPAKAARTGPRSRLHALAQPRSFRRNAHESRARSYMSYGRILFKNSATTLFGRLHVDTQNSFIADKCDLSGLWELARITKLPVQYCSRTTTGTGISYMQMELAWRDGVLIPEQKAEPEDPKPPDELLLADRGGLVFTPKTGFHVNVAELDFVSEYPSIMASQVQHFARDGQLPVLSRCAARARAGLPRLPAAARHHQPRRREDHREAR